MKAYIPLLTQRGKYATLWAVYFPLFLINKEPNMKNRIRELRNKRGISQTELANAIGSTKRTIYAIEVEDADIRVSLARKIADYFGCGIDDLYNDDGNRYTAVDKAMWYVHVVHYTAEMLGKPVWETARLLERSELAQRVISGYDVWHTQGYEYMAEVLSDKLNSVAK